MFERQKLRHVIICYHIYAGSIKKECRDRPLTTGHSRLSQPEKSSRIFPFAATLACPTLFPRGPKCRACRGPLALSATEIRCASHGIHPCGSGAQCATRCRGESCIFYSPDSSMGTCFNCTILVKTIPRRIPGLLCILPFPRYPIEHLQSRLNPHPHCCGRPPARPAEGVKGLL